MLLIIILRVGKLSCLAHSYKRSAGSHFCWSKDACNLAADNSYIALSNLFEEVPWPSCPHDSSHRLWPWCMKSFETREPAGLPGLDFSTPQAEVRLGETLVPSTFPSIAFCSVLRTSHFVSLCQLGPASLNLG